MVLAEWHFQTFTSNISYYSSPPAISILKDTLFSQIISDSVIHGQTIISPTQGYITAELNLTNTRHCSYSYQTFIPVGYQKQIYTLKQRVCVNDTLTLFDNSSYYGNAYPYWADSTRAKNNLEKFG